MVGLAVLKTRVVWASTSVKLRTGSVMAVPKEMVTLAVAPPRTFECDVVAVVVRVEEVVGEVDPGEVVRGGGFFGDGCVGVGEGDGDGEVGGGGGVFPETCGGGGEVGDPEVGGCGGGDEEERQGEEWGNAHG